MAEREKNRNLCRREFLRVGGLAFGGIVAAACSRGELVATVTAKETPRLIRKSELLQPPEIIEIAIPDLTIERYHGIEFEDITTEVPKPYQEGFKKWLENPALHNKPMLDDQGNVSEKKPYYYYHPLNERQCGLSIIDADKIRLGHESEIFFFSGEENRFYANIMDGDDNLLGWKRESMYINFFEPGWVSISCNGKILYQKRLSVEPPPNSILAVILADVPNRTKTIIRDTQLRSFESELTADGNKLLLVLPGDPEAERGIGGIQKIYLLDLNTWQVQCNITEPYSYLGKHLNEDGSSLYLNGTGCIYNTITKKETPVPWPEFKKSYGACSSRNLHYIARGLGMFSASEYVEGQWGIMAYTPEGFFMISASNWSFVPEEIDNDGTIYTKRWDVFRFENGIYKPVSARTETKDGKPIEIKIVKVRD